MSATDGLIHCARTQACSLFCMSCMPSCSEVNTTKAFLLMSNSYQKHALAFLMNASRLAMSHSPSKSPKDLNLSQSESNTLREPNLSQTIPKNFKDLNLVDIHITVLLGLIQIGSWHFTFVTARNLEISVGKMVEMAACMDTVAWCFMKPSSSSSLKQTYPLKAPKHFSL